MSGSHLDLVDDPFDKKGGDGTNSGRRFVGVHFTCCDVYTRVYVNRNGTAYEGNCPRCAKRVRLSIEPGGTDERFFTAR